MKSEGEWRTENGDPGVTRTRNILLRRQVLYPVELRGRIVLCPLSSFPRRREPMNADIGDFPHAPCSWIPACARMTDRTSGVSGKSVSVRVDLGGRRIIKKKKRT